MAVRSVRTFSGDSLPDFPLGGRCKVVDVGGDWVDLLGAWESDLLLIRVPQGSRRVIILSTTEALAGTTATIDQSLASWILDPGVWSFCTDRDRTTGPRFLVAIDPSDGSNDAATAALRVMEGATA